MVNVIVFKVNIEECRLLRREHARDAALDVGENLRRTRVLRVRYRGVHILAPKLALPPELCLSLLQKRRRDIVHVGAGDMPLDHPVETLAKRTLEPYVPNVVKRVRVGNDHRKHPYCRKDDFHVSLPFLRYRCCPPKYFSSISTFSSMFSRSPHSSAACGLSPSAPEISTGTPQFA